MKTITLRAIWLSLLATPLLAAVAPTEVKPDEQIQFMRGLATPNTDGSLSVAISAWYFESEMRPGFKQAFAKTMGIDLETISTNERANFDYRTQLFRFDSERNKTITVGVGETSVFMLPATDEYGLVNATIKLPIASRNTEENHSISFRVILPENDPREFIGESIIVPTSGLSIVSDIDDTIKDSHVLNRDELIKNTFLRDFKAVPGMRQWYAQLAKNDSSVRFHYLSSSPLQLYPALATFLRAAHFPLGSVHLRHISLSNELFGNGDSSKQHKLSTLKSLIEQFPQRQFMLIGDSGEADPEIYAEMARRYPAQVRAIYIRNVSQETREAARYAKTFDGIPSSLWTVFDSPPN